MWRQLIPVAGISHVRILTVLAVYPDRDTALVSSLQATSMAPMEVSLMRFRDGTFEALESLR